ncbi:hypothetical protein COOONC_21300 [Cooperia oncophora]
MALNTDYALVGPNFFPRATSTWSCQRPHLRPAVPGRALADVLAFAALLHDGGATLNCYIRRWRAIN